MEKIIESNKIDFTKNLTSVYKPSLTDQVIFLPIRHHSPICSYHIKNIIDEYKPEIILIEGPDNLNAYKENLFNPGSSMPLAFYTVYKEDVKNDDGSKEKIRESVYYPFADFSPEFVALNIGFEKSIETKFIDLPYSIFKRYAQNYENVLNDTYIQYSDYISLLCEKLNLRDFSEFWEKYFELNTFNEGSLKFIESMYSFCYYTRMTYSSNQLKADGTIQRELFMINNIYENMQKYKRILVITGGFHTPSLFSYNYKSKLDFKINSNGEIENYIVPFSYDSIDERSGYRSGITFPQYREHLLNLLHKEKDPFYENTLYFLHKFHNRLQLVKESGTIVNKIESLRVMDQLKQLRGKKGIGLYEMIDGVLSSYGKIEFLEVLQSLNHVLTGDKIGIYSDDNSPLLKDFIERLMGLLSMNQTSTEKLLYPDKSDEDKNISLFFHKLNFLDVNFATLNTKHAGNTLSDENSYLSEEWQLNMTISDGYFMDYSVADKLKHEERLKEINDRHEKITKEEKEKHKKYLDEKKEKLNDLNEEKKTKLKSLTDEEKQNYDKLIKEEKDNFNKIQDEENQRYDKFIEEENQRFEKSVNEENFRYERLTEERNKKYANLTKDEKEKHEKKLRFLNRFRVNTQIYVKLVEASMYGSTVDECCQNKFEADWKASSSFSQACELFVLFLKLNILPDAGDYTNQLEAILEKDNNIESLTKGFELLYQYLKVHKKTSLTANEELYQKMFRFDEIYEKTFDKIVKLLHFVDTLAEEEEEGFLKSLKRLFEAVLNDAEKKADVVYIFENLYEKLDRCFEVYGGISGMLYSFNVTGENSNPKAVKVTGETILTTFNSIVLGMNAGQNMAKYLKGLFTTARDLFVLDSRFLKEINELFLKLDEMEFLEILPLLRLAFTFFPPYELSQIAQNVATSLGTDINDIESRAKVDNEQEVIIGKILNNLAKEYLEKYKLLEL